MPFRQLFELVRVTEPDHSFRGTAMSGDLELQCDIQSGPWGAWGGFRDGSLSSPITDRLHRSLSADFGGTSRARTQFTS